MKQAAVFFFLLLLIPFAHAGNTVIIDLSTVPVRPMPPSMIGPSTRSHDCHQLIETRNAALRDAKLNCERGAKFFGAEACDKVKNCTEGKYGCHKPGANSVKTCNEYKKSTKCEAMDPESFNPTWYTPIAPGANTLRTFIQTDEDILKKCEEAKLINLEKPAKEAAKGPQRAEPARGRKLPAGVTGI